MKKETANVKSHPPPEEKRGHICPPSDATHPKDRWETAFVYSYICKFTQIKNKLDGFNSPMDLEEALLTPPGQVNKLLQDILTRFILILRPQSRNIGPSQLMSTTSNLLSDLFRTPERSVFWNETKKANVDPLINLPGGFWDADWDLKLKLLRQLVEYQLCHSPQIREILDRAWGVKQMQHKKKEPGSAPPEDDDPHSQQALLLEPLGQDISKKRYWVLDSSPRIYVSTNPWKVASTFQSISSDREEYLQAIENLKLDAPPENPPGGKRTKFEASHLHLISVLEKRLEDIDAELARVERARKKVEQRNLLLAQAEVRGPRTRRQAQRPDYVYQDGISEDDEGDDYRFEDDMEMEDDQYDVGDDDMGWTAEGSSRRPRGEHRNGRELRRSSRQVNGKQPAHDPDDSREWKGERRSRRLGATDDMDLLDLQRRKRSRTVESSEAESTSALVLPSGSSAKSEKELPVGFRATGAAALKSSEVAVDSVQGKKKNKYWFYAVEPIKPPPASNDDGTDAFADETLGVPRNRVRRIVESVEASESGPTTEARNSPAVESSAPMSLDSEADA